MKVLVEATNSMLPGDNFLHSFISFEEIKDFIGKLDDFGIDSSGTRYSSNQKRARYKLHENQSYLNLRKMHKNIKEIFNAIRNYIYDSHFHHCERGDFSLEKINELQLVVQ